MNILPNDVIYLIVARLEVAQIFRWLRLCSKQLFTDYLSDEKSVANVFRAYCTLRDTKIPFVAPKNQRGALETFALHHVPPDWLRPTDKSSPPCFYIGTARYCFTHNQYKPEGILPHQGPWEAWSHEILLEHRVAALCAIKKMSVYRALSLTLNESLEIFAEFFTQQYPKTKASKKLIEWGIPHKYLFINDDSECYQERKGHRFDGENTIPVDESFLYN
eukprot:TRINITY_DN2534_c0_g1_i1.p2 TRINITY_DN2534_c0_g1~~TRINITY_DN2534_c0_g1_i1.p2  ORF type:complete len:219 (+),score=19.75 TRINITY_DN2534_c0_g1_i1:1488-2144(+)